MTPLLRLLATPGVDPTLRYLASASDASLPRVQLEDVLEDHGAPTPTALLDRLLGENILQRLGSHIAISKNGRKLQLLLDAIGGADIADVFTQIQRIDGTQGYQLVREGMTENFFADLATGTDHIGSLYVCSPWIRLSERALGHLNYAFLASARATAVQPEVWVLTRPTKDHADAPNLTPFRALGARIFFHRTLHTKLYIREPSRTGGRLFAVVGSQNLTTSQYLELGIRISGDDHLIRQSIRYFMEKINLADEVKYC